MTADCRWPFARLLWTALTMALAVLTVAWGTPTLPSLGLCASAYGTTIEEVRRVWLARQSYVRSARFEWKEECFIAAHAYVAFPSLHERDGKAQGERTPTRVPERDLTFQRSGSMSLSGNMLRLVLDGTYWHPGLRQLLQETYTTTFDGQTAMSHHVHSPPRRDDLPPFGSIDREARLREYRNPMLIPLMMTFRPCDPNSGGVDLAQWRIRGRTGVIDGTLCSLMTHVEPRGDQTRLWVDPSRGFIVLRVEQLDSLEHPLVQTDISYRENSPHGWLPSKWKRVNHGGFSRMLDQQTVEVAKHEINIEIPRSEFQIEFPVDTLVRDLRTKEDYIAREEGAKRLITEQEKGRGASYSEYLATESGQAGVAHRNGASRAVGWALVGIAICLAIAGCRWLWAKSRSATGH